MESMVNHWIFVSVPFTDFNVGTICEILKKIRRTKKWLIGRRTPNKRKISTGDKVLFYQGGEGGGRIVASAELTSGLQEAENFDSFVEIEDFRLWENPVNIKTMIERLSFIKNKKHWGVYFQGGIIKIAEEDYRKLIRKAGGLH